MPNQLWFGTANDLQEWKDFPKGLRVLLLDQDINSAAQIRSKLEEMDYVVSTFCNENEALSAISSKSKCFHVAIVEVNMNSTNSFKFLETAKDLPTIMTSNIHCLSTMMKCIALGAVEFLRKPLSEDKLRNIWQHVVHKAFSSGGSILSESLKPVKESAVSMVQLQLESDDEKLGGNEKYPAPSTPQSKQIARLVDDGETNCSTQKENDGEVETTCEDEVVPQKDKEEYTKSAPNPQSVGDLGCAPESLSKYPGLGDSCGSKANRKKTKVDWTPELHKKFVQAVEQLGVDQSIPSRILELMKVDGLTRHNVASHLQKYRMQPRHILPKEDDRRWLHPMHKPIMAYPPYHPNTAIQTGPVWGTPSAGMHMWHLPWQHPAESWHWKPPPPAMQAADAWGCPVMPEPPNGPYSPFPLMNVPTYHMPQGSFDLQPAEEVIERVVKEAICKPWLPLPIGLRPPTIDSVLTELSRQGITINGPTSS